MDERISTAAHAVIRARFAQAAGDAAQTIADRNRPGFAAKADERDRWKTLDEQAVAQRRRQSAYCNMAADLMLGQRPVGRGIRRRW